MNQTASEIAAILSAEILTANQEEVTIIDNRYHAKHSFKMHWQAPEKRKQRGEQNSPNTIPQQIAKRRKANKVARKSRRINRR